MSQPSIPDINPEITLTRDDAINLLLASIAMEELGLAHIINAEGEKIQFALEAIPEMEDVDLDELLKVNDSVMETLDAIMRKEFLLDNKLKKVAAIIPENGGTGPPGPEGPPGPSFADVGFSARRASSTISSSGILDNWMINDPNYTGNGFDTATGIYTVPESGRYSIKTIINYNTTARITAGIAQDIQPSFVIRRTAPTATDLLAGLIPTFNTNIALLLELRVILGSSTIALSGDVYLNEDDEIGLFYDSDGLSLNLNLGGPTAAGTTWSMHKIAEG